MLSSGKSGIKLCDDYPERVADNMSCFQVIFSGAVCSITANKEHKEFDYSQIHLFISNNERL
jgi:hypothetical protein